MKGFFISCGLARFFISVNLSPPHIMYKSNILFLVVRAFSTEGKKPYCGHFVHLSLRPSVPPLSQE